MNSNLLKKIVAIVLTGLFLVSTGAIAAEKSCPKGQTRDASGKCVTKPK
jgi:hypothetical protein